MISITPQGEIYLCKTPLENDYKHQLTFSNANAQMTYFNSKIEKTLDNYTYIKPPRSFQQYRNTCSNNQRKTNLDACFNGVC